MYSDAQLSVLRKLNDRRGVTAKSPSETAVFIGVSDGFASFKTSKGDTIVLPVGNVITNQAWTGTFSVVRPKYGYPSVFKEV